jgi:uncharacterized phage protein (TIGR02218 family)
MTTFRGVELLDARGDRQPTSAESAPAFNEIVESKAGIFSVWVASRYKQWERSFLWLARNRTELVEMEEFIERRRGRFNPFWVPTYCSDLTLVQATSIGAHEIVVKDSEFLLQEKHVAVITPTTVEPFTIVGKESNGNGTTTLTLWRDVDDPGISVALNPNAVLISFLKYVRLRDDSVAVDFTAGGVASALLEFVELPYEGTPVDVPEGELAEPVECYHFVRGSDHWRWTSSDSAIEVDGETFQPAPITRSRIQVNEEAKTGSVDITVPANNEVAQLFSGRRFFVPVLLTIYRVQLDDEYLEPDVIFSGEAKNCSFTPRRARIHCVPTREVVNRQLAVLAYQTTCNNALFDARCQVPREDFTWTFEVEEIVPPDFAAGLGPRYIFGYDADLEFSGDTLNILINGVASFGAQRQMIVGHAGAAIYTLLPLEGVVVGSEVTVSAGCPKTPGACRDRFDNLARFLGFPHIPQRNPFEGTGGLT